MKPCSVWPRCTTTFTGGGVPWVNWYGPGAMAENTKCFGAAS